MLGWHYMNKLVIWLIGFYMYQFLKDRKLKYRLDENPHLIPILNEYMAPVALVLSSILYIFMEHNAYIFYENYKGTSKYVNTLDTNRNLVFQDTLSNNKEMESKLQKNVLFLQKFIKT